MTSKGCALVTGASRGIGRAIAEQLSRSDWQVVGTYNTNADDAKHLAQSHGVEIRQVDLADRTRSLDFANQIRQEFAFSVLINNAGIIEFEKFDQLSLDAWDRTFEVNLNAPLILSRALAPNMTAGGSIVNIASTDGNVGSYSSIAYSASKAALLSLTRSLANVLGEKGVRVNAVTPGWVDTGMSTEESFEAAQLTPLGRNGTPEDIANLVEFLISPKASFITGASFVIDGGYTGVDYIMKKENDSLG